MAGAHLYIGWRIKRVMEMLTSGTFLRYIPILFLLSFYLLPAAAYTQYLFWSDPDLLTYPKALVYWFWFGLIFSFQLATAFVIIDVLKLLIQFFGRWTQSKIDRIYGGVALLLVGVLFIFTAGKTIYDTGTIQTEIISFDVKSSESFKGLRLVHITDLQGDEYTGRREIAEYIKKVNALNPDLVIFTGDLISYGTDFIDMAAEELSKVKATYGLHAVIGDHDFWAGVPNIESAFRRYEIPLLQDENKIITAENDSLLLTGITEVYNKQIGQSELERLTGSNPNMPIKIMAAHQATKKVVETAREAGYEILLAGHTHGGQVRVPFLGMTFSAAEQETPYLSGVYHLEDLFINVNNGLGFTLAPIRYNAPPNISVIDLISKK